MNIFKRIKDKFYPFYKTKELDLIFSILERGRDKQKKVAMFVGGCVRKHITKQPIDDIDIATIFSPDELKEKFNNTKVRVINTGIEHGSVTLLINDAKFEITTLRKDISTDGRHAEVLYTDDWQEDSKRRDFTVNAIYLDRKGNIFDPQSGVKDLKENIIKFIGDPNQRIQEDYLRIIRYIRFSLQYNNEFDKKTLNSIKLNLNGIKNLSKERILIELFKILTLDNFILISKKKELKDIFFLIFPEFKYIDRLEKSNLNLEYTKSNLELLLAILLIDSSNNYEYFCHKYKTSNAVKEKLDFLSESLKQCTLDINYFKNNLKKNSYLFGKDKLKKLNKLNYFANKQVSIKQYITIDNNIDSILIPKFPFNGKYLIDKGLKEGRKIGLIIRQLEEKWIENNYTLSEKSALEIINKIK